MKQNHVSESVSPLHQVIGYRSDTMGNKYYVMSIDRSLVDHSSHHGGEPMVSVGCIEVGRIRCVLLAVLLSVASHANGYFLGMITVKHDT